MSIDIDDLNNSLQSNYMLVTLSMSRWGAKRQDRQLALETATAHNASPEAVKVTKNIMANADAELSKVNKHLNAIRTYLYSVSLPWANADDGPQRGPRLIPTTNAMNIIAELAKQQKGFKAALNAFKGVYDQRVQEALAAQGSLADASLYPLKDEIDHMFTVRLDYSPVPTISNFQRVTLPAKVTAALGKRMGDRQVAIVEAAQADMLRRTAAAVGNMATQLQKYSDGDTKRLFRSLIDNVEQVGGLLQSANLTDDPQIAELAEQVNTLADYDINDIKQTVGLAGAVAKKAAAVARHPVLNAQSAEPMMAEADVYM